MKAMKFRVKNEQHSMEIQKCLFELGYSWAYNPTTQKHLDEPYLFCGDGQISYGDCASGAFFDSHEYTETTLEELKASYADLGEKIKALEGSE